MDKIPLTIKQWIPIVKVTLMPYPLLSISTILAMIWQESEGQQFAYNPEPRYRWLWDVKHFRPFRKTTTTEDLDMFPPKDFPSVKGDPDNEWWAQKASWGLMQVMGAVARERGFRGLYLPQITDPTINIKYGVEHLWLYALNHGKKTLAQGLLSYNGGGDKEYPDKIVMKRSAIEREWQGIGVNPSMLV